MTGLEIIRAPGTTAEQIADIVAEHCPPVTPEHCDKLSCRECWLAWLATGEPPKEKGPSDKQTAPDEEGLHPNLATYLRQHEHLLGLLADIRKDVALGAPGRTFRLQWSK